MSEMFLRDAEKMRCRALVVSAKGAEKSDVEHIVSGLTYGMQQLFRSWLN